MKIDDLLALAGEHPLNTFQWGPRVVDVINFMFVVSPEERLTVELSGTAARAKIRTFDLDTLTRLSAVFINPHTGEVCNTSTRPVAPVAPAASDGLLAPLPDATDVNVNTKSTMALVIGASLTLAALMTAVVSSTMAVSNSMDKPSAEQPSIFSAAMKVLEIYKKSGTPPDDKQDHH